jgi:predicted phosphodiesterase
MRIALLADIHGNFSALEAVMADIAGRSVDQVVTLGDHVSGPLLPRKTAAFLRSQPWLQIAGNHERQLVNYDQATAGPSDQYAFAHLTKEQWSWLRTLPPTARLEGGVLLCHGSPRSDAEYLLETVENGRVRRATATEIEARLDGVGDPVVVCGHSHLPCVVRTKSGQLLVNPGSVGLPAFNEASPSYHVVETGSSDARYAVMERREGGWSVALLSVAYDYETMAKLADHNNRPAWSYALRTGYVQSNQSA